MITVPENGGMRVCKSQLEFIGTVDTDYISSKITSVAPVGRNCKITVIIEDMEKDG